MKKRIPAFSLIELLCVVAIIGILLGLMAGPITRAYNKAKRFEWENNGPSLSDLIIQRLAHHFGTNPNYPAHTVDELFAKEIIDSKMKAFLKDKRVEYVPFSSKDPSAKVIFTVTYSKHSWDVVTKSRLEPPKD